jgi:hypothetical protein
MITSWADEEDKTNAKYDSIRGKSKNNTGDSNSNPLRLERGREGEHTQVIKKLSAIRSRLGTWTYNLLLR